LHSVARRFGRGRGRRLALKLDHLSHSLAHWSIQLSPQAISLQEGLRAAVACALVMGVVEWTHWKPLAWAAISALWTCLADPGGEPRRRLRVMVGYSIFSTAFAMIGAGAGGMGLAWSAVALFLCTLVAGMAGAWGLTARQCGVLALVACAVAIDSPKANMDDLLQFGAVFAGGCVWATFLSLTVWRIHPFRPARQAIADVYEAMAALVVDLGARAADLDTGEAHSSAWARVTVRRRAAVRAPLEAARTAIDELLRARRSGPVVLRLTLALSMAERIFTELIALDDLVQSAQGLGDVGARARHIRVIAVMLRRMANWLAAESSHDLDAEPKLAGLLGHDDWEGAEVLSAIAEDLVGFEGRQLAAVHPEAPPGRFDLLGPLKAELRWHSVMLRQTVRCAVLVTVVLIGARMGGLPRAYWATMAVILVHQSQLSTTWPRALERSVGTVIGGLIALLLALWLQNSVDRTIAVFPLAMLTMAMRRVNYTLFIIFLTPLFVTITGLTQPAITPTTLAIFRVLDNLLGCFVAMIGTMLIWPVDEHQRLDQAIAGAIEANGRYARLTFTPGADWDQRDEARRAAGLGSNAAEGSWQRASLEGRNQDGHLEIAEDILAMLRQLVGGVTVAWLHPPEDAASTEPLADWIGATIAILAEGMRRGSPPAAGWPAPPEAFDTVQEQTVHRIGTLRRAVLDYIAARRAVPTEVVG
jgi:uncharacterized membrane protein YccC